MNPEILLEAFRKAFPADAMVALDVPDAETPLTELYPLHIFTPAVCAEIVAALEIAMAGAPLPNWFCYEFVDSDAEIEAFESATESLGANEWVHRYAEGSIEYVAFGSAPGYFAIELGGSNVMSGVTVYAWR